MNLSYLLLSVLFLVSANGEIVARKAPKATKVVEATKAPKATKAVKATKVPKAPKAVKATKVPKAPVVLEVVQAEMSVTGSCDCAAAVPPYQNELSATTGVPAADITVQCTPTCGRRRLQNVVQSLVMIASIPVPATTTPSAVVVTIQAASVTIALTVSTTVSTSTGQEVSAIVGPVTIVPVNNTDTGRFLNTVEEELKYVSDCEPGECDKCTGDCSYDTDCASGLRCFNREANEVVPGCISGGVHDVEGANYCFEPLLQPVPGVLNYIGECRDGFTGRCDECQGDCDEDADCMAGLVCFQREDGESIPGCAGGSMYDIKDKDYCFKPNKISPFNSNSFGPSESSRATLLNYVGECDDTAGPCGECEGDCDSDDECSPGLSCFHRVSLEDVPGCSGGSEFDIPGKDYCYKPEESTTDVL